MKAVNTKLMLVFILALCINIFISYGDIYEAITGEKTNKGSIISEVSYIIDKCNFYGGGIIVFTPINSIGAYDNITIKCVKNIK